MPPWPPIDAVDTQQADEANETDGLEEGRVFECVQGYVTLEDADGEEDGGLVVLDRGHKLHQNYFATQSPRAGNFHMLKPDFLKGHALSHS